MLTCEISNFKPTKNTKFRIFKSGLSKKLTELADTTKWNSWGKINLFRNYNSRMILKEIKEQNEQLEKKKTRLQKIFSDDLNTKEDWHKDMTFIN